MTAIWNNFAKGAKSLEYYGDVLTKLGATTAANTTEIATAMEKFAATAEVIGLSYETAASAVATVVAETRQSADVVGTAYKTIFARIQGLKLGETLEDGVGLNQYSEALRKVGVRVIDASGNLRRMDDILADLGDKWNELTDAQRNATAQTVAGLRQYNQFIALMENWDNGDNDSMMANLDTSYNATGAL
jgi:TP901 family phage tail tape measure protein